MSIDVTTEKRFESDIEEFFLSPAGGYTHNQDAYDPQLGVYQDTLLRFIQKTQPKEWKRFLLQNKVDPERKFCLAFNNACDMDGLISVLRHGFKHRGIPFKVCYFKPESGLNQTAMSLYEKNEITCNRQWFYSNDTQFCRHGSGCEWDSGICSGIKESVYRTECRSCKTAVDV